MINYFNQKEYEYVVTAMGIFHNITKIPCILVNEEGDQLYGEGDGDSYYQKLEAFIKDEHMFKNYYRKSSHQAEELGEAYISYGPVGLVHYAVSISSGQIFKGAIIAGPFHMSDPDDYEVDQVIKSYPVLEKKRAILVSYYQSIPVVSTSTARYQLELLTLLGKDIMGDYKERLNKKKAFYKEQRILNERIQALKEIEPLALTTGNDYPIKLEKNLATTIIKGDELGAKAILNELLGYIFFKHTGNNRKILVMTMELVVVMSRAAIEGGAKHKDVSILTQELFVKVGEVEDIEIICHQLIEILEKMILFVFPIKGGEHEERSIIRKAIIYMNQHLQEEVLLENVARIVNLSPTYFSRLFSNQMEITFIEYLTMIRIEESKKYLVGSKQSISDIAFRMGFSDQSYFSKVFKKVEGMTPGKYRKMYL